MIMPSDIPVEGDPASQSAQGRREAQRESGAPPASFAATRERLIALAQGASIETSARNAEEVSDYGALVTSGTPVYIAWIPGADPKRAVDISARLASLGLRPVPHIAARELDSLRQADTLIRRLREEAGVREMLLIAGDRGEPRGPYADSLALLRSGLFQQHGVARLGVAAYPEGHARMDPTRWREVFREKESLAQAQNIELTLVTQFGFDGAAILDWLRELRRDGVETPVRIGMAGPAKVTTLIKYGIRCGVGNSLRFLTARPSHLAGLLAAQGPEDVLLAVANAGPDLRIAGAHVFAFGGFAQTARWIRKAAAGEFELGEGAAFKVRGG